jgi:hypothetical protein
LRLIELSLIEAVPKPRVVLKKAAEKPVFRMVFPLQLRLGFQNRAF